MAHGRTLFISDLHLDASDPAAIELFCGFLRTEATACDALYILGDLFETWIGDDDEDPARARVCTALHDLTCSGVPCFIQHGNRDFLLGSGFMQRSGCLLLPDPAVREFGGRHFVLTHGDALCTEDHRYQRFRWFVRSPGFQWVWRTLPLALRRRIGSFARRRSRAYTSQQPEHIMDVTPAAVTALLRATKGDVLVHGHTHRPAVHQLELDGRRHTRIVLGDWHGRGDMLIVAANGQYNLQPLQLGKVAP